MAVGRPRSDRQLAHCREEGANCHECVRHAAVGLVRIASDLSPSRARQLFTMMYPDAACLSMASAFIQIVNEEKTVEYRRPMAYAAVA